MSETARGPTPSASVEEEVIGLFVHFGQLIGAPKSLGTIYGFLFVTTVPVTFDEIVRSVHLSTGSVSQGLKMLRAVGAVQCKFVAGDRRDHYVAETRLRHLVVGFLRGSIDRQLADGEDRLQRLLADSEPNVDCGAAPGTRRLHPHLQERLQTLQNWHLQARGVIPALLGLLNNSNS